MSRPPRISAALGFALVALAAVAPGCGDGEVYELPRCDECPIPPTRDTPESLLMNWFEGAYSQRDSILYAEMLDSAFTFEFLPVDAESAFASCGGCSSSWGRRPDLQSAGAMFRTERITGITLDVSVDSNAAYVGDDCIGCRQLETTVALRIAMVWDGTDSLVYTIDSPQTFVTKRDSRDSSKWVLFRQIDGDRVSPKRGGLALTDSRDAPAVVPTTWGRIKGVYRP